MPLVDFELTIPVFERAKTVHALDRPTTVIGLINTLRRKSPNFFVLKLMRPVLTAVLLRINVGTFMEALQCHFP
jgi:hypothetical protein